MMDLSENSASSLSKSLEVLKKQYRNELIRKYLSGMEEAKRSRSTEMTQIVSRRFTDAMIGGKEKMVSDFISDFRLAGLSVGHELEEGLVSRARTTYDRAIDGMIADSIRVMAGVVEDYFRWTGTENLPKHLSDRVVELIDEAADKMARLDILESEVKKVAKERFRDTLIEIDKCYKALGILEEEGEMTATELASKLNVAESTVRRYLSRMIADGYVEKDMGTRPYVFRFASAPWVVRVEEA